MPSQTFTTIICPETRQPLTVARNLRDDLIGQLHADGTITTVQYNAARAFQADIEETSGQLRGPTNGLTDIGGWKSSKPSPDRNRRPTRRIAHARDQLGTALVNVLHAVAIGGQTPSDDGVRLLHQALDKLAVIYGLATPTHH
jgi:YD repeat-containing protein